MPRFRFRAVTGTGEFVEGELEAQDQAAVVAHVAAHELGAAAYAIKAARAAASAGEADGAGRIECDWQRRQLPDAIRELVLDDQRLRNEICWSVFEP